MTQKTVGYVKLEWTCPNCGTKNPGPQKTCTSCGLPQPDNIQFEQPAQTELLTDQGEIAQAKAGPDVHCYYCGTRNPATAKTCSQCGADLTQATARASGQVMGAHRTGSAEPIICPSCGASNEPDAAKCVQCGASLTQPKPTPPPPTSSQLTAKPAPKPRSILPLAIVGGIVLLLVGVCITFLVLSARTTDVIGAVESVSWSRIIIVEQLVPVSGRAWRDQIPAGAIVSDCREEQRGTESQPSGESREVCGTPYVKDTGTGLGEVVQDCETEPIYEEVPVYDDMCSYTVTVWQKVDEVSVTGSDLNPDWPEAAIAGQGQRVGGREEKYEIVFDTDGKTYTYTTGDVNEFKQFQPGSRWVLNVNTFDIVTSVEPAK